MTTTAKSLAESLEGIEDAVHAAAERYRVPGAALAIRRGDDVLEVATGVVNKATGVETTADSVFQIGSITKVFTTTLMMQLVDEGRVKLDEPVRTYLPEFLLADIGYAKAITVRHLLTHTSGMDGDYFRDTGRGADAVDRYVYSLGALPSLHAPGEMWSYCNSGFAVAGRIIERATGLTWDDALKQRLLRPAGIPVMGTLPEEAILHRAAAGHMMDEKGEWHRVNTWVLVSSNGPAGATPFATARELLTFGWLHFDGGRAENGQQLLSPESVAEMQREQVTLPGVPLAGHWGLGWMLFDWGGTRIIGHDGGTIGQSSFLRLDPSRRFGVALLTNGGNTQGFSRKVLGEIFERADDGVTMPPLPEPTPGFAIDPERYVGRYGKLSSAYDVTVEDGRLVATATQRGPIESPGVVYDLEPIDDSSFATVARGTRLRGALTFLNPGEDGRFEYVRDSRLHRRTFR